MRKMRRLIQKATLAAAAILPAVTQAAVTVNPTNAFTSAEDGFNYGGGMGLSLLAVSVVLGGLMFGWRLKSGRGK